MTTKWEPEDFRTVGAAQAERKQWEAAANNEALNILAGAVTEAESFGPGHFSHAMKETLEYILATRARSVVVRGLASQLLSMIEGYDGAPDSGWPRAWSEALEEAGATLDWLGEEGW
jgi:hypothetical protein